MNSNLDKRVALTEEESKERSDGQFLFEMTQTPGFKVLKERLDSLAFHSWVDPREAESKQQWEWQELNAFHAANNAKELIEWINQAIGKAEYLEKKRRGELQTRPIGIK